MKILDTITLLPVIVGGINWGLVGATGLDLVAAMAGGQDALLARVVYVLVGLAALYQVLPLLPTASRPG